MRLREWGRALLIGPIMLYRRVLSPALPRRCRYEPTCSTYALRAIERYGIMRGLVLGCWRLVRCNPWSRGGFDPVENQHVFRRIPAAASTSGERARPPAHT